MEKLSVVNSASFVVALKVEDSYMLGFILFSKQDLVYSRLASYSLCGQGCSRTPDFPAATSQVLRL